MPGFMPRIHGFFRVDGRGSGDQRIAPSRINRFLTMMAYLKYWASGAHVLVFKGQPQS
jgi:hypothetical protein